MLKILIGRQKSVLSKNPQFAMVSWEGSRQVRIRNREEIGIKTHTYSRSE
jgi:hypothetical protein